MAQVSVIIPVYNGEKYIAEALDSVFAQSFRDFEVIVVDDGSTDGTERVLSKYREKVVYLRNERGGPASSRNRGLAAARGSLIAFLDADDLWAPAKLEKQVAAAMAQPEYGIITTDAATFDETGITEASAGAHKSIPSGYVLEQLLFDNWIGTSCVMVRRECFDKIGTFVQDPFVRGEDWVMWMRIAANYPVYFLDEVLVHYRVHSQSYSRTDSEKQFNDLFINFEKVERMIPQLSARPELLRKAKARVCFQRGWDNLLSLELDRARDKLRGALRYKQFSAKAWAALAISYLPPILLRAIKRAGKTLRPLFFSRSDERAGVPSSPDCP